ncbi:O-methyltransferase OMT [Amycolatopsis mediterranei S699]|uniref:O-methyltransferase OMT n=2 Tax=Amycolatopsis mediterranei TaxID=33910 RepID=A0A0H3D8V4_AMYMU|nr:class I SAM-dependent methyltransferase [Amycolatopsis mediterranei]ADJ45974.1 O-methyltransferase OMT [Amycolatopsis mediterranei U32]AFO77685.1 O-methyltransferase OMT [Amycolatopsis mediterranei S699]AGT84813.1 O-methyltransferase OMT [Amycolatopsis mediterranei RB]UZF71238.1 class I SAM-dependent methyltransferase [Amycolatopsis mediterranei]
MSPAPMDDEDRIDGAALGGVAATCLWTLRNRAEESRHPGSAFADPLAERLHRRISHDYERFGKPNQIHPLRAVALDFAIRAYLDRYPAATVVALGEGLQTTYWRLGRPAVDWVSVDLPPVIGLRLRLLPPEPRMTAIAASALDRGWLDVPDPARGVFISAEGLFMYLDRDEVFALIADCAARFPGGQLFFDSIPPWLSRRTLKGGARGRPPFSTLPAGTDNSGLRLSARYAVPPMPFGLTVSGAARLPGRIPGVAAVEDVQPPPGRKAWRPGTLRKLANLPGLRDLRPSISLVSFAGPR